MLLLEEDDDDNGGEWGDDEVEGKSHIPCKSSYISNESLILSFLIFVKEDKYYDIEDISMIILCTGYEANVDYLDSTLLDHDVSEVYRSVLLIRNPNMMFIHEWGDMPLIEIDVRAWLCLAFITGAQAIPAKTEMIAHQDFRQTLYNDCSDSCNLRLLTRDMNDANYPLSFGTFDELNWMGEMLVEMTRQCYQDRLTLSDEDEDTKRWKTFRDADPSPYTSYITGTKSIPLEGKWLEMDDQGMAVIKGLSNDTKVEISNHNETGVVIVMHTGALPRLRVFLQVCEQT